MDSLDHDVFEGAVHAIAERAANTNKVSNGAMEVGLVPITRHGRGQGGPPMHEERGPAPAEVYEVRASIAQCKLRGPV